MRLRDDSLVNEYILHSILAIQNNKKQQEVFNQLLLDGDLYSHSVTVCRLATQMALAMGFTEDIIHDVCMAGMLHDVGKLFTPKDILYKPAKLTPEEFEVIKKHPLDGYNLLKGAGVNDRVLGMVLNHHEKNDGSGYPNGVESKTLSEDIVTTADIFSALTEPRVYHSPLNIYDAINLLNDWDNLNRDMVDLLKSVVEE